MKRRLRLLATGVGVATLVVPQFALAQPAPVLRDAPDSGFPDRAYVLQLPSRAALKAGQVDVTENGGLVNALAVKAPGNTTGVVLLIDASNSMRGAPIAGAMAAARAFMAQRLEELPVAVVVFGPDDSVLTDFTTDKAELAAAVAEAPPLAEGTHIYDALGRASELVDAQGLERATIVLLSDGTDVGSDSSQADALAALSESNTRVISVGLKSDQYDPATLRAIAKRTGGTYAESATPAALAPIFADISSKLSSEYVVTYRSLLPSNVPATVTARVAGFSVPATAKYTTPKLVLGPTGSFDRSFVDDTILSGYLLVFVIVAVLALLAFALVTVVDVRQRSVKRRMAQYVNVPTDEESHLRHAEVTAMLADRAQRRFASHRWWQAFQRDVELADFRASATTLLGWTVMGGIAASIVFAILVQSLAGLLVGLLAPVVTRTIVSLRLKRKRAAFAEQLPDNLDVLAGALRAGHSLIGAMNVLVDGAAEPSKTEFRRVIQDEQLGIPVDQALQVMATRMLNDDVEQVALVTRLSREAGGNTAEVLDRVVENIRGKMELRRLVQVLTAQGRLARWILTALPLVLVGFLLVINPNWLDPLFETTLGRASLVLWVFMLVVGTYILRKITEIVV